MEIIHIDYDSEANGLLNEVDKVWCASFKVEGDRDYDFILDGHEEGDEFPISKLCVTMEEVLRNINSQGKLPILVCHNQFGYDLELFRRVLDIPYSFTSFIADDIKVGYKDTLDISQSQWPDRPHPKGCPHSYKCPVTGKTKRIGSHGLEAWGYRVANAKPEVHDWRNGDPRFYLHRCKEDVKITRLTRFALDKERDDHRL